MKSLVLAIALAAAGFAQTAASISQVKADAAANSVLVVVPGVGILFARLDPSITLDMSSGSPVLKASAPAPVAAATPRKPFVYVASKGVATITLPDASYLRDSLAVYRNGLLQAEGIDYRIDADGKTVTLLFPAESGDIYQARFSK